MKCSVAPAASTASRARFSALRDGFAFLDAPGGTQVPDEVGTRSRLRCVRRARTSAPAMRPAAASGRSSSGGGQGRPVPRLRAARGDLRAEHDLAGLHALAHRRARLRARRRDPRLLARPRRRRRAVARARPRPGSRRQARRAAPRHHARLRRSAREADRPHARRRVRLGIERRSARSSTPPASASSRTRSGALAWIDAVHYAAHEPIDVRAIDADVLLCSPYKFCGPHLGMAYGRAELLETWRPYKARPAPIDPLGRRFETGTLPYELLAGFNATIDYLDSIGGMDAIVPYERALGERFLDDLPERRHGLRAADDGGPRADLPGQRATASRRRRGAHSGRARHRRLGARQLVLAEPLQASWLRDRTRSAIGFIHYNTAEEVDRFVAELAAAAGAVAATPCGAHASRSAVERARPAARAPRHSSGS